MPDAKILRGDDTTSERINTLRDMVDQWRKGGWQGVTLTTSSLLEHWTHEDRDPRLYWAQIEALETLIWLYEVAPTVPKASKIIREINASNKEHNDSLRRISSKMATGTGKTVVMAMIIAWHTCNYRNDPRRFSNQFAIITPGLIIRDRLQELLPRVANNVYDRMGLVPLGMRSSLKSAHVRIVNYQSFRPLDTLAQLGANSPEKRLLVSHNSDSMLESDPIMLDRVLEHLDFQHNIVVINDEAHHCYKPGTGRLRAEDEKDRKRVAMWFKAVKLIDRLFSRLLNVYDLSATPKFIERGEKRLDSLFPWTVSDFPITDAIESGMVKIPRVPTVETGLESSVCRNVYANTPKSYREKLDPQDMPSAITIPLDALYKAYEKEFKLYKDEGHVIPPVFIIVVDSIRNARAFYEYVAGTPVKNNDNADHEDSWSGGQYSLFSNNPQYGNGLRTIMVHSRIDEYEHFDEMKETIKAEASRLKSLVPHKTETEIVRDVLASVGKEGKPGEQIRCVISVSMLTEGWDAKNVTHVFGYRAFGTQLLCEQVSGRALRRPDTDSSEWHKSPVFAEIFGIPFDYMNDTTDPRPPKSPYPQVHVFPKDQSEALAIEFPLVETYSHQVSPNATVRLDSNKVNNYVISSPVGDPSRETLAGIVGVEKAIDPPDISLQAAVFRLAKIAVEEWLRPQAVQNDHDDNIYNNMSLFAQMRRNVDAWLHHPNVVKENGFKPHWLSFDPHISAIPHEIIKACNITPSDTSVRPQAIFSSSSPASTNAVRYYTSVPPERVYESPKKCQHNCAPCDSLLEMAVADMLDKLDIVVKWTRNHNINSGWNIPYYFQGRWQRYYPDFIAQLKPTHAGNDPLHTVIEVKGVSDDRSRIKAEYARDVWTRAVQDAGFGRWEYVYITDIDNAARLLESARGGSS